MLISPGQTLFGVSAQLLRFAAIELSQGFDLESLCWELGAPPSEVQPVLDQLVNAGWVTPDPEKPGCFVDEAAWRQLRLARTGRPLARTKADVLIADLIARVRAANRQPCDDVYLITGVYVFGSYLDMNKAELGDVDIAFSYAHPSIPRPLRGFSHRELLFRERATVQVLKNKSPYLSICERDQLDILGCESRELYSVKNDAELWSSTYKTAQEYPEVLQKVLADEPVHYSWRSKKGE